MEDITQQISKFALNPNSHGSLSGIIKNNLNKQITKKRKGYWAVTDISNPLQAYFKIKYPEDYKESIETKKKFALGNKQHAVLQKKLEFLEGFIDREIIFDGRMLGINLIGRVDSKIKENIWEIKSKERLPVDKNELIENYPQDIEQICFYSLIDPEYPKENILIFTTHSDFNQIKAFKIKINDFGKVKNLALNRINNLDTWLDREELPPINFKCRYCYEDCSIRTKNKCPFFENPPLLCGVEDFIEIEEILEIEEQLKKIKIYENDANYFSIFNIITPRQIIHREYTDIEEEPFDNSYKKQHQHLIQNILYEERMSITNDELKRLKDSQKISEINQYKNSFIKLNLNGQEKIFPLLIHVSDNSNPATLLNVSSYKKGELGLQCLNNGISKGYLISYFPEQNNEIRVFEINYNFEKGVLSKLKKIVDILKIKDKEKLNELPMCPSFMCKDCVYRNICLS